MTRKKSKYKPKRPREVTPMHVFVNSPDNPPDQKARLIVGSHMAQALVGLKFGVLTEKDKVLIESSVYAMCAAERAGVLSLEEGVVAKAVDTVIWLDLVGWHQSAASERTLLAEVVEAHRDTQINMSHQDALRVSLAHEKYYPEQFARSSFHNLPKV